MDQGRAAGWPLWPRRRGERGCSGSPAASFLSSLPVLQHTHERQAARQGHPPWGLSHCSFYHLTGGMLTWVVLWHHIPPWPNAGLGSHGEGEAGGCYCSKIQDTIQCDVSFRTLQTGKVPGSSSQCPAAMPFSTLSLFAVGLESWAWCSPGP